jgi:phosphatidate cytidylyltransferase
MLKTRLITAGILIPIVLLVLFSASTFLFVSMMGIFVTLGAWEWAGLCLWEKDERIQYALGIGGLGTLLILLLGTSQFWLAATICIAVLCGIGIIWWLVAWRWVIQYQKGNDLLPSSAFAQGIIGGLVLLPAWLSLFMLYQTQYLYVLFLLVLIWSADTGAYIFGRAFGKRKLAVRVSPGKTWEGAFGGLLFGGIVAGAAGYQYGLSEKVLVFFIVGSLLIVAISILGDLLESLYKRRANLKDSSQLLPGHGGILDRIDSVTSAAPFFFVMVLLLGFVQ